MTPRQYPPSKYKARYESLPVILDNGSTASVKISKYCLASSKDPRFAFDKTAHDAFEKRLYDEKSVRIHVDAGEGAQEFELKRNLVVGFARLVFEGKGAPEHCQIILQLASRWHSEKPHQPLLDLQAYADRALGLDCNGFVGNCLLHILHEQDWRDTGTKNSDADGPSSTIPTYFNRVRIRYWQDMQPDRCYIFGMVGRDGNIVRGGSGSAAAAGTDRPVAPRSVVGFVDLGLPARLFAGPVEPGARGGACDRVDGWAQPAGSMRQLLYADQRPERRV